MWWSHTPSTALARPVGRLSCASLSSHAYSIRTYQPLLIALEGPQDHPSTSRASALRGHLIASSPRLTHLPPQQRLSPCQKHRSARSSGVCAASCSTRRPAASASRCTRRLAMGVELEEESSGPTWSSSRSLLGVCPSARHHAASSPSCPPSVSPSLPRASAASSAARTAGRKSRTRTYVGCQLTGVGKTDQAF